MAADFLDLLLFGMTSPELETFLSTDLSDKGLKKMDQSINMYYTNVQNLIVRYLLVVIQSLCFYLSRLLGEDNLFLFLSSSDP